MELELKVAIIGFVSGIIGSAIIPSIGYLIKRKIERKKDVEDIEIINSAIDTSKKVDDGNFGVKFEVEKYLKSSLGSNYREYFSEVEEKNVGNVLLEYSKFETNEENIKLVDEGWLFNFVNNAKYITDDQLQKIWGQILSGEINEPGSYNKRTIDTLKRISKTEAEVFKIAASLAMDNKGIILVETINDLDKYGLDYGKIQILRDAGLLSYGHDENMTQTTDKENMKTLLIFGNQGITFDLKDKKQIKFDILNFTQAGRELLKIVNVDINEDYLNDISDFYTKQGY